MRTLGTKYVDQHEKNKQSNQLIKLISLEKKTLQPDLGGNFFVHGDVGMSRTEN